MRIRDDGEHLDGEDIEAFRVALTDAFNISEFDILVREKLNISRERIVIGDEDAIISAVIDYAERKSQSREFLLAAFKRSNGNPRLSKFAQKFGLLPSTGSSPASSPATPPPEERPEERLERKIREHHSYLEVTQWRTRLEQLERQICRIMIRSSKGNIYGTGFLLAPDVVMTNYHVVEGVISGEGAAYDKVTLFFDYKLDKDGELPLSDNKHKLAEDWLIDYSPYSPHDLQSTPTALEVEPDKLDYALLRLNTRPGEEAVKDSAQEIRGWIEPPEEVSDLTPEQALFILHHPEGDPMKLALDTQGIKEVNANKTRVRYYTNTENGSSGAPCFDANWNLVAIHQSGDPNFRKSAEYNQGIPFITILELLKRRGKKGVLGGKKKL